MSVERSRLRRGEWIVGAGSVLLLAPMLLLPWFGSSRTVDGWNALTHFRWLAVLTLLAAAALLFFQATRRAPAVPATLSLLVTVLGALTSAWLIYRVGIDPAGGRKVGAWIALAAAITITYGGFSSFRTEGIAGRDAPSVIPTVDPWAQGGS
jgi:hypothetical protein